MGVGVAEALEGTPGREKGVWRRRLARAAPLAWLVGLIVYTALGSFPLSHGQVIPWVVLLLVACCVASPQRRISRLVVDWLPFVVILFAYSAARGVADGLLLPTHFLPQIDADVWLFGGETPTAWLQAHLYHGPAHLAWYDWGAFGVYLTHFFATLALAAGLWLSAPHRFRRWVAMVAVLAGLGFVTYALFPAAPPWMAGQRGLIPPVERTVEPMFAQAHLGTLFHSGRGLANDVAAMPSLHAGFALLVALYLFSILRSRWRWLLFLYPLAMGWTLVYTGEHFAIDVFLGWIYAAAAFVAVQRWAARRAAKRARAPASAPAPSM